MAEQKIFEHYSRRNYIETYFKEVKQNFGLKAQVFSTRSINRHVELVQLAFTVLMLARFYRSVKDRIVLRDFLRFNYFFWIAMRMFDVGYLVRPHPLEFFVNSKCIS
ncbi:hypothetical protein [Kosmotoga pacifica]|uniref:Transposase IS4-like domain-containing protein n=1 Tax=Kosmotoga pacifica TaxID=1330330 RepID=A0A0G2ZEM0_9BACT|nr:hypothetical protein [Kosmotoga pacifica]AKI97989.1 hypothetical protein IX53_09310 [Kosmotoga pacifica]